MKEQVLVAGRADVKHTVSAHLKTGGGGGKGIPRLQALGTCLMAGSLSLQSFQSLWLLKAASFLPKHNLGIG